MAYHASQRFGVIGLHMAVTAGIRDWYRDLPLAVV